MEIIVDGVVYRVYDHLYAVSEGGDVIRNLATAKLSCSRKDGYLTAGRQRLVHRMVAICWVKKPEGSHHVHHVNGDKSDNRAENLQWVTPKQHMTICHPASTRPHTMSEAGKQRLRESRLGCKSSEATKQKQREAALRLGLKPPAPVKGCKLSEETKLKMSRNHGKKRSCIVKDVAYESFKVAGLALGERPLSLRKRCLSANFPDYQLAE